MRVYKLTYVVCVLIIGWGSMAAGLALGQDLVAPIVILICTALLTYPLGFLTHLVLVMLNYFGITTGDEAFVVAIPVSAALGYLQWFRILPWVYRAKSQPE